MLADGPRARPGTNQPDITDVAQGVANRANELMENAASIVSDRLGEDIHNTLIVTQRAMNTLATAPEGPFVKQTTRTLQATERLMQRVDSMLGSGTGANIDSDRPQPGAADDRLTQHDRRARHPAHPDESRRGNARQDRVATRPMYHDLHELSVSLTALLTDLKEHPDKYMKPGLVRVKLF